MGTTSSKTLLSIDVGVPGPWVQCRTLYCWIGRFKPALEHKLPPSVFHHALALICERTQLSLEAEPLSTGGVQMLKNRQVPIQDLKTAEP